MVDISHNLRKSYNTFDDIKQSWYRNIVEVLNLVDSRITTVSSQAPPLHLSSHAPSPMPKLPKTFPGLLMVELFDCHHHHHLHRPPPPPPCVFIHVTFSHVFFSVDFFLPFFLLKYLFCFFSSPFYYSLYHVVPLWCWELSCRNFIRQEEAEKEEEDLLEKLLLFKWFILIVITFPSKLRSKLNSELLIFINFYSFNSNIEKIDN